MFLETKRSAISRSRGCHRSQAGLTLLELIACSIAVIGGAWLGVLYLGVDMRHVAFAALSQSKLLDKVPTQYRPADPNQKPMTHEQLLTSLHDELGALKNQISSLHGNNVAPADDGNESERATAAELAPTTTKEKTLAYWQRLNEIANSEKQLQAEAETAFNSENAAKVFAVKGRISRFSAKAIEAAPKQGVDEAVVRFGRELGQWYDRADELYESAVRIWETPMGQQARTQSNQEWKRSDNQHLSEGRLLVEKATAVRASMSRIYGVEFPAFDTPSKPGASIESTGKSG